MPIVTHLTDLPPQPQVPCLPETGLCREPEPMHKYFLPITVHGIFIECKAVQFPDLTYSTFIRISDWKKLLLSSRQQYQNCGSLETPQPFKSYFPGKINKSPLF